MPSDIHQWLEESKENTCLQDFEDECKKETPNTPLLQQHLRSAEDAGLLPELLHMEALGGQTLLMHAAMQGRAGVVSVLLEAAQRCGQLSEVLQRKDASTQKTALFVEDLQVLDVILGFLKQCPDHQANAIWMAQDKQGDHALLSVARKEWVEQMRVLLAACPQKWLEECLHVRNKRDQIAAIDVMKEESPMFSKKCTAVLREHVFFVARNSQMIAFLAEGQEAPQGHDGMCFKKSTFDNMDVRLFLRLIVDGQVSALSIYYFDKKPEDPSLLWMRIDRQYHVWSKEKGKILALPVHCGLLHVAAYVDAERSVRCLMKKSRKNHGLLAFLFHRNSNDQTALHVAAFQGSSTVVHAMLQGAGHYSHQLKMCHDPLGRTALHTAAQRGHAKVVVYLLKDYGLPSSESITPLHEQRDDYGETALHLAAREGHLVCLLELIQHARKQVFTTWMTPGENDPESPLVLALKNGHTKCFEALLKAFDFYRRSVYLKHLQPGGKTLMAWVITFKDEESEKVLLKAAGLKPKYRLTLLDDSERCSSSVEGKRTPPEGTTPQIFSAQPSSNSSEGTPVTQEAAPLDANTNHGDPKKAPFSLSF